MVYLQDCHFLIAQVEYQGQWRYARLLDCKPFINAYYHIQHRLELKYFLHAGQEAHRPQKSENWELKIEADLQVQAMDGWSVTQ